jgi:hypothetical protein
MKRSRTCEGCGEQMIHLGNLPSVLAKPALKVFRCYGCNNVVSEAR